MSPRLVSGESCPAGGEPPEQQIYLWGASRAAIPMAIPMGCPASQLPAIPMAIHMGCPSLCGVALAGPSFGRGDWPGEAPSLAIW